MLIHVSQFNSQMYIIESEQHLNTVCKVLIISDVSLFDFPLMIQILNTSVVLIVV